MRTAILAVAALIFSLQIHPVTPKQDSLMGTWKLVSASASSDGHIISDPFGPEATGLITYTADGRMMAVISYGGRKPLSGDRISSPEAERAEAFSTFFAYAGKYSVNGDEVVHHVEVASVQNWVNTDLVRRVTFEGNRLTLRTPPVSVGGKMRTTDLVWERLN